ncbi:oxidoreductase [Thiohalorhabdus denitrificans]|uniref:Short-chain dehydrogenase n=1 Tax=Thiohalorhabdus denitrificans TaxID=381306 RepID=A0A0P9CEK5_9GAMM|nr:SDR family NAD(P)-dependent oxidoreductase [Thiohalorhabdus denitrificans]KPV41362.1 oxidoreductase [Thiohalorhabdus denitrificans]SCY24483.1 Short-chain dehydrogenase [Thiohalorhabdus denitrificans]
MANQGREGVSRPAVAVTGCSSGIGACIAQGLHERGYRVLATARREEDRRRLTEQGLEALPLELADRDSVAACAAAVAERAGGSLVGLVNNAAYGQPGAVEDLSREVLEAQFQANLLGTHDLTVRLLPVMREQGFGRMVQISSLLGLVALRYRGAYNASKFALEGLTDTLRLELAGSGVHPVLVEPGPVTSRFRENAFRAFQANIDVERSPHRETYEQEVSARLAGDEDAPFTLGPEAVLAKTVKALEARRPRPRYYVTFPTYLLAGLKWSLPVRTLDPLLRRIS